MKQHLALLQRAAAAIRNGSWKQAKELAAAAIELVPQDPLASLLLAEAYWGLEDRAEAHAACRRALSLAGNSPDQCLRVGRSALRLQAPEIALAAAARGDDSHVANPLLSDLAFQAATRMGLTHQALAALRAGCAAAPRQAKRHRLLVRQLVSLDDPEQALIAVAHATSLIPADSELQLLLLALLARLGRVEGLRQAWQDYTDLSTETKLAVVRHLTSVGLFEEALALCSKVGTTGATVSLRARLHLWQGQYNEAATLAGQALETAKTDEDATITLAASEIMTGAAERGLGRLRTQLAQGPNQTADIWQAEALRRLGRHDEAITVADHAISRAEGEPAAGVLVRLAASLEQADEPLRLHEAPTGYLEVSPILESLGQAFPSSSERTCLDVVEAALDRLGGNRSDQLTIVEPGGLFPRRFVPPRTVREVCRRAQLLVATRSYDEVVGTLRAIVQEFDRHPLSLTYLGEVLTWAGSTGQARACFEEAIAGAVRTRWAWIGLGATHWLDGDPAGALSTWTESLTHCLPGPTLYAYRGEVLRRLDRPEESRSDLLTALRSRPRRLATLLNLALLDSGLGDDWAATTLAAELTRLCPDIASACGASHDAPSVQVLDRLLAAMRGNRSSVLVTFFDVAGRQRRLPWSGRAITQPYLDHYIPDP